jgi:hypothetical protein
LDGGPKVEIDSSCILCDNIIQKVNYVGSVCEDRVGELDLLSDTGLSIFDCLGVYKGMPLLADSNGVLLLKSTDKVANIYPWNNVDCPNSKPGGSTVPFNLETAKECIDESNGNFIVDGISEFYLGHCVANTIFSCPVCPYVGDPNDPDYIGLFSDECCESVSGCEWEVFENGGKCVSTITSEELGPALDCANTQDDELQPFLANDLANKVRALACVAPCVFTDGGGTKAEGDTCEECSAENLNICDTKTKCLSFGGFWKDNQCLEEIDTTFSCPVCEVKDSDDPDYIGEFTDECCESVPGCVWESISSMCTSVYDEKESGPADGCADTQYAGLTPDVPNPTTNKARKIACAGPCVFIDGGSPNVDENTADDDVCAIGIIFGDNNNDGCLATEEFNPLLDLYLDEDDDNTVACLNGDTDECLTTDEFLPLQHYYLDEDDVNTIACE